MPERTCACPECGTPFTTSHPRKRWCSKPCTRKGNDRVQNERKSAYRALLLVEATPATCEGCGGPFLTATGARFCGKECSSRTARAKQLATVYRRTCRGCLEAFETRDSRGLDCSPLCRQFVRRNPGKIRITIAQCECCGVIYSGSKSNMRFCSRPCRLRANADVRRARKYGVGYEWINRTAVFERDGWNCKLCGDPIARALVAPHPRSPSLDHIVPLSRGGQHRRDNVQAAHLGCNILKGNRPTAAAAA